jgi:hypothetical protein
MAAYSDWEIHSANSSDMQTAVNFLGFTQGDGFTSSGIRYSINIYGTKYVQQGTTTQMFGGNPVQVPNMVAQPGVYAILRWFSSTAFPPAGVNIPPQVTIIPIPANSPYVFAAG